MPCTVTGYRCRCNLYTIPSLARSFFPPPFFPVIPTPPLALVPGSNKSGPYNDESIEFLATHFPMVTIEKFQGPCGYEKNASPACHQESLIIAELKRVKVRNPNVGRSRFCGL